MVIVQTRYGEATDSTEDPTAGVEDALSELFVVVPAHNEQQLITKCISSLVDSQRNLHEQHPYLACHIIAVLDDCDDRSGILAQKMGVTTISVNHHRVGAARRAGAHAALALSVAPRRHTWLASTDADCQVPVSWLPHFVEAAMTGYQMVLGMVRPAGLPPGRLRAWRDAHPYVEGHPHIHGANLGIRADLYENIGGWSALATGEDVDLAKRAERQPGTRILRTANHPVWTSSRSAGRAPAGFADYLCALPQRSHTTDQVDRH